MIHFQCNNNNNEKIYQLKFGFCWALLLLFSRSFNHCLSLFFFTFFHSFFLFLSTLKHPECTQILFVIKTNNGNRLSLLCMCVIQLASIGVSFSLKNYFVFFFSICFFSVSSLIVLFLVELLMCFAYCMNCLSLSLG